jgi:hypothetical protein
MLYTAIACMLVSTAANYVGKAEVSTSDLRTGAAFNNLKAEWGRKLSLGDFSSQFDCTYDHQNCKDFLKDAKLTGNLVDSVGKGDDIRLDYEVTKNFQGAKNTEVKLTATTRGTKVTAEIDSDANLKEVSAQRVVTIGDRDFDMEPSWLVKSQTMRVKMMSTFARDTLKAQIDYDPDGRTSTYELGYERDLEEGKTLSATLVPADKSLEVELVDTNFESGATWTATANIPTDSYLLDDAKVSLKRAWAW